MAAGAAPIAVGSSLSLTTWNMKRDKHFLGAAAITVAIGCLIVLTWIGTLREIRSERQENTARVETTLSNQALGFSEQINRQIMALDGTLRVLVKAYESDPQSFSLAAWREQLVALNDLGHDVTITDATGLVRQSSAAEAINRDFSGQDYFQTLSRQTDPTDRLFLGSARIDDGTSQWHMNVARALRYPDGSFAGVINIEYRTASITELFNQTELGPGAFEAVVGLRDGRLRAVAGPRSIGPGASIEGTPVFAIIEGASVGFWVGPSPLDGVTRVHAFRYLPDRSMAVIVAMNLSVATRPAMLWQRQADLFAVCITVLLAGMGILLVRSAHQARLREAALVNEKAVLASANRQLEEARAIASDKAEQLATTLSGMTDGVSMFDAQLRLVQWNDRFPELVGIPAGMLYVGLPVEDVLRAQILAGQFGPVDDPDAEIARRVQLMRSGAYPVVERQRLEGHSLELRRKGLPEGGFVTLYADITEHEQAEAALREARASAEMANAAKSRFVAIVSHEIRNPLNALLNTLKLLASSALAPTQEALVASARQSGDALSGLINDILEMSQIEAGKLMIRPVPFDLRALMTSSVEMFEGAAAERGITLRVFVDATVPTRLHADAGRLRQVLLNLLSNAVKYSGGGEVWLQAEPGRNATEAAMLLVKDRGPVIDAGERSRLFQPFSRLERSDGRVSLGSGLGLSICQELVSLMGGSTGCDPWTAPDGQPGNAFWLTLPATALPVPASGTMALASSSPDLANLPRYRLPRTRILLVEDVTANQIVTATLLRREGHLVDVAGNGTAAIEAMRRSSYDLVFMDIFMPGVTGLQATAAIRSLPGPAATVPIIALTADAEPGQEINFLASGIDGILRKPVSLPELLAVLRQNVWWGPRAALTLADTPASAVATTRAREVDPAERDAAQPVLATARIRELRSNLPPQTFVALVESCLVDLDDRLPELRQALAAGSARAVTAQCHAMVGMAGGYGMAALESTLRAIMTAARAGDAAMLVPDAISRVEYDLALASRAMRAML